MRARADRPRPRARGRRRRARRRDARTPAACASSTPACPSRSGPRRSSDAAEHPEDAVPRLGRQRRLLLPRFLPAVALGADYVAWVGDDKARSSTSSTGLGARPPKLEELFDYDVIVIQQPRGVQWLKLIRELQAAGVTVLYEIDDYVQAARKIKSHELTDVFDAEFVGQMEMAMRVTDGIICSTRLPRAPLPLVQRPHVGVLQRHRPQPLRVAEAGAQGRDDRLGRRRRPQGVARALGARRSARSCARAPRRASCPSATAPRSTFIEEFGRERAIGLPSGKIEVYPASMTLFDIAIAPSSESNLFRGKSDLRWLEASALGIPLVAHPERIPAIEDGVTGVHARTPSEVEAALLRLIDDAERARAHRRPGATTTSPSTGASRSRPSAGATCCSKSAPVKA